MVVLSLLVKSRLAHAKFPADFGRIFTLHKLLEDFDNLLGVKVFLFISPVLS
jgi:hypothetical protein